MALAPNVGSRNTPSVLATSRAAACPAADGMPYPGPVQPSRTSGSGSPAPMPPSAAAAAASSRIRARHSPAGRLTVTPTTWYGVAVRAAPATSPAWVPQDPVASHSPAGGVSSPSSWAASSTLPRT